MSKSVCHVGNFKVTTVPGNSYRIVATGSGELRKTWELAGDLTLSTGETGDQRMTNYNLSTGVFTSVSSDGTVKTENCADGVVSAGFFGSDLHTVSKKRSKSSYKPVYVCRELEWRTNSHLIYSGFHGDRALFISGTPESSKCVLITKPDVSRRNNVENDCKTISVSGKCAVSVCGRWLAVLGCNTIELYRDLVQTKSVDCGESSKSSVSVSADGTVKVGNSIFNLANVKPDAAVKPAATKKTYACHICDKSTPNSRALKVHFMSHTKLHPWKCSVCDMKFVHRSHISRHRNTHHESGGEALSTDIGDVEGMLDAMYKLKFVPPSGCTVVPEIPQGPKEDLKVPSTPIAADPVIDDADSIESMITSRILALVSDRDQLESTISGVKRSLDKCNNIVSKYRKYLTSK